jgi:hypothetical protein
MEKGKLLETHQLLEACSSALKAVDSEVSPASR